MTRNTTLFGFAAILLLTACGTPQENCIRKNTRELRVVRELLSETEANIARGYAFQEREVVRTRWGDCRRIVQNNKGEARVITSSCLRDVTTTERYRVPIDPLTETRKRDNLRKKSADLNRAAAAAVTYCRTTYPE